MIIEGGLGSPSQVAQAMELGVAAVLVNTAVAQAIVEIKAATVRVPTERPGRGAPSRCESLPTYRQVPACPSCPTGSSRRCSTSATSRPSLRPARALCVGSHNRRDCLHA
nr:hypothetical protein [Archangium violaceum]